MNHVTRYCDCIENFVKMNIGNEKDFNVFVFRCKGIRNDNLLKYLQCFSPLLFYLNVFLSLCYILIAFLLSFIKCLFRRKHVQTYNNVNIFLFFTPLFYGRSKAANLFDNSLYWLVSPEIDIHNYDLTGKVLINYQDYITAKDCLDAAYLSFKSIFQYARFSKNIYSVYKAWSYHLVQMGVEKIVANNNIYFSNQSDRWALMFDTISTNEKTLIQHGIDTVEYEIPHKLKHINVFYAISNTTWYNSFCSLLDCKPELRLMKATFNLTDIRQNNFAVLIVSNLMTINIEKKMLEYFSNTDVILFVKKHPTQKEDIYLELKKQFDFNLINDSIFPRVDFVISYFSTLAYEYAAHNIPVYMYYDAAQFDILQMEKEYLYARSNDSYEN